MVGYVLASLLLLIPGAILLGVGVSALVSTFTGRSAIRHQSAKEANLWRKEHTYGPLYAEVKAVRSALFEAHVGNAPVPLRIDNGIDIPRAIIFFQPSSLTLQLWPELRRGYHDTDFKVTTREQLNRVDENATAYNAAVEAARQSAVTILGSHIDAAIAALPEREEYKQRQQQTKPQTRWVPFGQEQKMPYDWYGYIEFVVEFMATPRGETPGSQLADQWLSHWPDPVSVSLAPGWLLAEHPDEAAEYVSQNYSAAIQNLPQNLSPPSDWIHAIFEMAWPDLQEDSQFGAARDARELLWKELQHSEDLLDRGLRDIQRWFEGGDPLV